jgi:hypothetical protein
MAVASCGIFCFSPAAHRGHGASTAQAEVAPISRAPSDADGGLQGSGDIGKLMRLVFSSWGGSLCAFYIRVVVLVTSDGRLGFGSLEFSLVMADLFSSPVNLGGGRRCSFSVPGATWEWIHVTALAASPCFGTQRQGCPVNGVPVSVSTDGAGLLCVCALRGLECNFFSFGVLTVMWGVLSLY